MRSTNFLALRPGRGVASVGGRKNGSTGARPKPREADKGAGSYNSAPVCCVGASMMDFLETALGLQETTLTWWQMSLRAVVVFLAALAIIRLGNQRIFGKQTTFDIVLGIIYGSILSRAITGNAPFGPTLVAALVLVLLHRGLATLAYYTSGKLGFFIKGDPQVLVRDGQLQQEVMRKNSVTAHDLEEAMREKGNARSINEIEKACLERSGNISIVPRKQDK